MKECCETCKLNLRLERSDFQRGGCVHEWQPGYICLAFQNEDIASWMVGQDPENGMCECYIPKRKAVEVEAVTIGGERIKRFVRER